MISCQCDAKKLRGFRASLASKLIMLEKSAFQPETSVFPSDQTREVSCLGTPRSAGSRQSRRDPLGTQFCGRRQRGRHQGQKVAFIRGDCSQKWQPESTLGKRKSEGYLTDGLNVRY